jgi:hypothetical protein
MTQERPLLEFPVFFDYAARNPCDQEVFHDLPSLLAKVFELSERAAVSSLDRLADRALYPCDGVPNYIKLDRSDVVCDDASESDLANVDVRKLIAELNATIVKAFAGAPKRYYRRAGAKPYPKAFVEDLFRSAWAFGKEHSERCRTLREEALHAVSESVT